MTADDDLLRENERLLEFLYLCPVGLAQIGPRGEVEMMNSMGAQLLLPLAEGPGLDNLFQVLDPLVPELRNLVLLHSEERGTVCEGVRVGLDDAGDPRRPEVLSVGIVKIDAARFMAVIQDITRTVRQERLIFADQQRFQAIFEGMRDAMICMLDGAGAVATWNTSGERLLGFTPAEAEGRPFCAFSSEGADAEFGELLGRVRQFGWGELTGWYPRKTGEPFWGEGVIAALRTETGHTTGFSVVLRDMTERKRAADKLVELATQDALTGLSNRRHWFESAERELARWKRHHGPLAVLMLDADRFKVVNDTFGHGGGDEVLRDMAAVLRSSLRASDMAARYGGEEFIVLLPETSAEGAMAVAERIRKTIASRSVGYDGRVITYTVSIGAAVAESPMGDLKSLIAAADTALYAAKESGRNRVSLYERAHVVG